MEITQERESALLIGFSLESSFATICLLVLCFTVCACYSVCEIFGHTMLIVMIYVYLYLYLE